MPASVSSGGGSGGSHRLNNNNNNNNNNDNYGVVATQYYESGPPASKMQLMTMDDADVYETVKEEEWLTRKKVTTTTTKNIETRTQRQVVLQDGEVVEDSGPVVTTDCKEDTVTNEVVADEHATPEGQIGGADEPPGDGWVPVGGAVVVSEKKEHITNSHQVAENKRETEEITHCGDVTNQEVEDHVVGRGDLRALTEARQSRGWELAKPERRVVQETARKWGTVNTEDVHETSRIQDGHVVTETERTTQHEEYDNESFPDSGSSLSDGSVHEEARQTQHNIVHTKDEDLVEYYAVPRGGTLAQGVKLGEGMHVVSEDFHEDREGEELDSLSERLRRARRLGAPKPRPRETPERTDALTRRPLDYHQEEETRKSETNRWLENHFGSESGRSRSGSSHHEPEEESAVHTAGGNVITITMSPRPATPEDQPDAAPSSMRRWGNTPLTPNPPQTAKAPPPPPPPKPSADYSISTAQPTSSSSYRPTPVSDEITDSMIVAARAKLRSTGRVLDDSDPSSPPTSPPATNETRYTSLSERVQALPSSSIKTVTSPVSPTAVNSRPTDDPVYSSRFRSGSPHGFVPSRFFSTPNKSAWPATQSPPDSPPPPLPSTPPPQNSYVGRSQSFNVATKSWLNNDSKNISSRRMDKKMKEYRSEENLDAVGHKNSRRWPPPAREVSPEPPRESTPPPPPRQRTSHSSHSNYVHYNTTPTRSSKSSRVTEYSTQTVARDSATQTGPSPVPPPRTKRKTKPKTYYFGQDITSSVSSSNKSTRAPVITTTNRTHSTLSNSSKEEKHSPKIERRFRTTKTITPVVVASTATAHKNDKSSLKNQSWHYRSMDELSSGIDNTPKSSWTNTVDPRRRPRNYSEQPKEPETRTLPKKLVNGTSSSSASPSKSYIFGGDSTSSRSRVGSGSSSQMRRSQGGSMINVSLAGMSSPKRPVVVDTEERQAPPRTNRHVTRSHSLNVKPLSESNTSAGYGSGVPSNNLTNQQRSSSVYRSSPYLNLRSPNLIATIARSNSTRRTDEETNGHHEEEESPQNEYHRSTPSTYRNSSYSTSHNNSYSSSSNVTHNNNRTNSRKIDAESNDDEKRNRFMKGLLTSAPELYHFIHGEDEKDGTEKTPNQTHISPNPPESPPQLIRPPGSPASTTPPASTAPRIFTFGRGETGSLKRTPSLSQENNSNNRFSSLGRHRDSITSNNTDNSYGSNQDLSMSANTNGTQRNSLTSQYHRNALMNSSNGTASLSRPRFNLKTTGGSLLYSPSFRNRTDSDPSPSQWNRRGSDSGVLSTQSNKWRNQDDDAHIGGKVGGNVTSNLTRDGAVLIPVRDWNSR